MGQTIALMVLAGWLAAATFGGNAGAAEDGWHRFRSEEGGFQVEIPGVPVVSRTVEKTFVGDVTNHLFTVQIPSEEFVVEYSDLPRLAMALAGPSTILKKAKDALLKDVRGDALTFRIFRDRAELSYVGHHEDNPGVAGFARFFLRGNRIYVLHILLSNGRRIDPDRVNRFYGSFSILDPI